MSDGFSNPIIGGGGALVYPSIHSPNYPAIPSWSINKDGSANFSGSVTSGGTITGANIVFANGYLSNGDGTFSNVPGFILYSSNPPNVNNLLATDCPAPGVDKFGNNILQGFTVYGPTSAIQFAATGLIYYTGTQTGGWTSTAMQVQMTSSNTNITAATNVLLEAGTLVRAIINGVTAASIDNTGLTVVNALNAASAAITNAVTAASFQASSFISTPSLTVTTSALFDAQGSTPASNAGNSVIFSNSQGEMVTIDGGDGTTYVMQRRTVDLSANSGSISTNTPTSVGLQSATGSIGGVARKYRFEALLYITTTGTPQFGFELVVPATADGLISCEIFRAATWIGSVQAAPNAAAAVAIALSTTVTYMVKLKGSYSTTIGSGNTVNLNVFNNTTGVGSFTVNKWSFMEVKPF